VLGADVKKALKLRLAQEDEDTHEVEAGLVFVVSVFWEVSPCFW